MKLTPSQILDDVADKIDWIIKPNLCFNGPVCSDCGYPIIGYYERDIEAVRYVHGGLAGDSHCPHAGKWFVLTEQGVSLQGIDE